MNQGSWKCRQHCAHTQTKLHTYAHTHVYIYMCVCVCKLFIIIYIVYCKSKHTYVYHRNKSNFDLSTLISQIPSHTCWLCFRFQPRARLFQVKHRWHQGWGSWAAAKRLERKQTVSNDIYIYTFFFATWCSCLDHAAKQIPHWLLQSLFVWGHYVRSSKGTNKSPKFEWYTGIPLLYPTTFEYHASKFVEHDIRWPLYKTIQNKNMLNAAKNYVLIPGNKTIFRSA
jgi:hypothetical protein